jgi:hypothetical protein
MKEKTERKNKLHELINGLSDPAYATLRALTLVCTCSSVLAWRPVPMHC